MQEQTAQQQEDKRATVVREFASVINRNSLENDSNTPDFILAQYLVDCLMAWNRTINVRAGWYGKPLESPGGPPPQQPESAV